MPVPILTPSLSHLRDPGDGEGDAVYGVDLGAGDLDGHDVEGDPLHPLDAGDDEGPAAHHDQGTGVEAARDDDGLVGAARDEAHPAHAGGGRNGRYGNVSRGGYGDGETLRKRL